MNPLADRGELGECLHVALRKCCDSDASSVLYVAWHVLCDGDGSAIGLWLDQAWEALSEATPSTLVPRLRAAIDKLDEIRPVTRRLRLLWICLSLLSDQDLKNATGETLGSGSNVLRPWRTRK